MSGVMSGYSKYNHKDIIIGALIILLKILFGNEAELNVALHTLGRTGISRNLATFI